MVIRFTLSEFRKFGYWNANKVCVLILYLWFLFIGNQIYFNLKNHYRGLIVLGLTFSVVLQALVNISVAIGLFPVTGQNLPLISTGGTSIIVTCINFGFIIGITKKAKWK